jgi:hypothetical protein
MRFQTGHIYEASGSFFVRFRVVEITPDGQTKRVQRSHRLCFKDERHPSTTSKAVRLLAAEHMAAVNAQTTPTNPANDQTVRFSLIFVNFVVCHEFIDGVPLI